MTEKPSGSPDAPTPKKKKRLTKKQAKLARAAVRNPDDSLSELGEKTGYSDPAKVHRALALPHVQDRMQALMDLHPATSMEGLHKKLVKGLEAKETKFFAFEGSVVDEKTVDDNGTQFRYFEKAAEMRGLLEKRVRLTVDPPPPMSLAEARRLLEQAPNAIEGELA